VIRLVAASLLLWSSACTEIGDPVLAEYALEEAVPSGPLTFADDIAPILDRGGCTGCHVPGGKGDGHLDVASAALILMGGDQGDELVPCDHEASRIWQRIDAGEMPLGRPRLSQIAIDTIAKWIDQGGEQVYTAGTCPNPPLD